LKNLQFGGEALHFQTFLCGHLTPPFSSRFRHIKLIDHTVREVGFL
jgi:hypothetical protein